MGGLNGSLNLLQIILYFTSIILPFDPHVYSGMHGTRYCCPSSFFKRKMLSLLFFSFAMLGIIGYFALSALQSGDESSMGLLWLSKLLDCIQFLDYLCHTTIFQCTMGWDFI